MNPGYHEEYRCKVLVSLEDAYDEFLDRAEAFHLDEEMASRIWRSKLDKLVRAGNDCEHFVLCDMESVPGCRHALGFLCVKALPECKGQCSLFRLPPILEPDDPDAPDCDDPE